MIFRLLGVQGIAGLVASLALLGLLLIQKGETRHWRKSSDQFEQLYHGEQAALAGTVANYRAAAETARAADRAAAVRVQAEQQTINERSDHDLEIRLANARASAQRLRVLAEAAAHPGAGGATSVHGLSTAGGRADQTAGEDRLSKPDALTATEQAIQLDELIKWVTAQHAVDPNKWSSK